MKLRTSMLILATLAFSAFAFAQDTGVQVRYASHLLKGESWVNMINGDTTTLCANLYAFNFDEELVSCCACPITVNGVVDIAVNGALVAKTLTGEVDDSVMIEEITTTLPGSKCDATAGLNPVPGIKAFGTALHQNTATGNYDLSETPFTFATQSANVASVQNLCNFLKILGSGQGVCKGCAAGALGASHQ